MSNAPVCCHWPMRAFSPGAPRLVRCFSRVEVTSQLDCCKKVMLIFSTLDSKVFKYGISTVLLTSRSHKSHPNIAHTLVFRDLHWNPVPKLDKSGPFVTKIRSNHLGSSILRTHLGCKMRSISNTPGLPGPWWPLVGSPRDRPWSLESECFWSLTPRPKSLGDGGTPER